MSRKMISIAAIAMILLGSASLGFAQGVDVAEAVAAETHEAVMTDAGAGAFTDTGMGRLAGPIGAGLVVLGGGMAIGRIGSTACESIARQPEAGGRIFMSMLITASLIEGATLFGVVVCFMPAMK